MGTIVYLAVCAIAIVVVFFAGCFAFVAATAALGALVQLALGIVVGLAQAANWLLVTLPYQTCLWLARTIRRTVTRGSAKQ